MNLDKLRGLISMLEETDPTRFDMGLWATRLPDEVNYCLTVGCIAGHCGARDSELQKFVLESINENHEWRPAFVGALARHLESTYDVADLIASPTAFFIEWMGNEGFETLSYGYNDWTVEDAARWVGFWVYLFEGKRVSAYGDVEYES